MSKRSFMFLLFVASLMSVSGQSPLDAFKYIIIPKKYDFLKEENQYRVNSTTKYLFEQNGFKTLLQGEDYPDDLMKNPCLAATADIMDDSSLFTTKLYVLLRDCHDQEVYRSEMGKSKEKSYDKTYIDALNKAFVSIGALSYQYRPELVESGVAQVNSPVQKALPAQEVRAEPELTAVSAEVVENKPPVAEASLAAAAMASDDLTQEQTEEKNEVAAEEKEAERPGAESFGNDNISFLLIAQGDKLVAYVSDSKQSSFQNGEILGTLQKTSLPNVYRASWKGMDKSIDQTTAYFDDKGNLKIDVNRDGKIEVLTFVKQ